MIKKIAIGVAVLVVLFVVGGVLLMSNLDSLIKIAIEKYASEATQATVHLDSVKLALKTGEGGLYGLTVGNPKGYSTNKAISLGTVSLRLDTSSIQGNGPIVIHEVVIDQPQIAYELLNSGDSNLQTIQHNTQAFANSLAGGAGHAANNHGVDVNGAAAPRADANDAASRKIIIEDLTMKGGQVSITQELLKGKQLSASLPELHLTDIGKASGGATAAQVIQQVLGSISNSAAQVAVTELAKAKIQGVLKDVPASAIGGAALDNVGSQLKGILGQ